MDKNRLWTLIFILSIVVVWQSLCWFEVFRLISNHGGAYLVEPNPAILTFELYMAGALFVAAVVVGIIAFIRMFITKEGV